MKQVVSTASRERLLQMEARHRDLETRLSELGRRAYLTPRERVEITEIKKRKLLAKDEIVSLRRVVI